ncbi:MAG: 50S ribosomal protein L11 methyltransferase, partial [Firmicutes bacterium]|nr:50S ribosomal protein L11 methyltransferase [Bacillota bacterium]
VIEIDPGMAFGTGTHETTSLCLELIEKYIKEGDTLLDVGCGSGILAIAAGLLGASDVLGIEIDPVAVEIGNENVALNNLSDKIKVIYGDLTKGVDYKADIVAANLMADLVKMLSPSVPAHLREGGIYISSGILAVLAEEVSAVIEESGFEIVEIMVKGEWCAIAARQK